MMRTYELYLNGEFVKTAESIDVIDPATEAVFARASVVNRADVKLAIEQAQAAFESWRTRTAKSRGDLLLAVASEMSRRADEIATTMTQEAGKPLDQSRGEVAGSIDHLRWFAEEGRRAYGRIIPNQTPGKRHLVVKRPIGVVGAITPWNFPLILAVRKIAPALAAGCTVVLKPAETTPLVSLLLAECFKAANAPPGILQVVLGDADAIGCELMENPLCRKVSFTGSTRVGRLLIQQAAARIKPLSLELGGHAPALVFNDCDLEKAVEGVLAAKFRNSAQSCIAANRIYVQAGVYDRFLDAFVERTRGLKIGNGLEGEVDIGALINHRALDHALNQVADARERGARVLCGGKRWGRKGWFMEPTVLVDVPPEALCMREETFAPIAPLIRFDDERRAIALANHTPYGLAAYAFTRDLQRMFRLAESLEAGTIGINDGVPSTSNAPFGGVKQSGWGRELGAEGVDAFLETKHVSIGIEEQ